MPPSISMRDPIARTPIQTAELEQRGPKKLASVTRGRGHPGDPPTLLLRAWNGSRNSASVKSPNEPREHDTRISHTEEASPLGAREAIS
jgi:hypothetical protein